MAWAWLFWAAVILGLAAACFLSFVIVCILDPPKTREGWRRELADARGPLRWGVVISYIWHSREKGKENEGTSKDLSRTRGSSRAQASGSGHSRVLSKRPRSSDYRKLPDGAVGSSASASCRGESPDEEAGLRVEEKEAPGAGSSGSAPSSAAVQGLSPDYYPSISSSSSGRGRGERGDAGGADEEDEHDSEFWKALVRRGKAMGI